MVRNPVDLVHSLHGQRVGGGTEPIADFAEALEADHDRRAGRRMPEGHQGYGVAYRDNALQGEQLQRWLASFGAEQVHVIVYDDFARDAAATFRSVLEFLGADSSFQPTSFDAYKTSYRKRGGPLRSLYRNRLSRWLSRRALPAVMDAERAEQVRKTVGVRRVAQQRVERPAIGTELRSRLEQEFATDVDLLGRLIGRDLTSLWFGHEEVAPARRPDFFIVGAPKAGTTSLYEYLDEHPDVFMSSVKEPMYFSPDLPYRARRDGFVFDRDEERYLALFAGARSERRVGEASTHYMASHQAPGLIRTFQPEARIVCILRDPVEVAYAWHGEGVFRGGETARNFDLALLNDERGVRYLEIGSYGSQLTRWFEHFGRERVHVIIFEDFVRDTPTEFRRLLKFLDVDPNFQPSTFGARNTVTSKSRLVPRLRRGRLRRAANGLRRVAGPGIARALSQAVRGIPVINHRGRRAVLATEVRHRLEDHYRDEIELAGRLIGRDLTALWTRASD
ncbi:MAG: sulfotransferase [Chloroflexota bacterium]